MSLSIGWIPTLWEAIGAAEAASLGTASSASCWLSVADSQDPIACESEASRSDVTRRSSLFAAAAHHLLQLDSCPDAACW